MAKQPARPDAHDTDRSPAYQAFNATLGFVEHTAMVAQYAREYRPRPDTPDAWQDVAYNFAEAFIAWYDLTHLLTPAVCTEARRVYTPGAASIKLGASNEAAPVVPAMPASVVDGLAAHRRVTLGATPYPTVIEAVADELGVYFRNAVYIGRRHPLEPDLDRLIGEAKARATERQVAQGKPADPMGWGADLDELTAKETRAVVRERLGIKTYGDALALMMREWNAQDRTRGESALWLLRCDPINFPELRMQLRREAEAVIAASESASEIRTRKQAPPWAKKPKRGTRALADEVRGILGGDLPFEGTKAQLARRVGYSQQSCLARISGFEFMWDNNAKRLKERRRASADRMTRPGG